jgi:4-hydroxy-tetrahydrodipicolinate reductase
MGREIAALAAADPTFTVVGGLSRQIGEPDDREDGVLVVSDLEELLRCVDVLIDFTAPAGTVSHAQACASFGVPLVSGTTGLDGAQVATLRQAAAGTAIFHAANMSPGVNAVLAVLPALVAALADYDVEVIETHHRFKADAPSGTALALAHVAASARGKSLANVATYGRKGAHRRESGEIGIHAVRGGGNPGEHEVILVGEGEEIRLSIRAFNRTSYAQGALRAARLLVGKPPGWYEPKTLAGFLDA